MPRRRTLRPLNQPITAILIQYPRQEQNMHSAQIEDNSNRNSNNSSNNNSSNNNNNNNNNNSGKRNQEHAT